MSIQTFHVETPQLALTITLEEDLVQSLLFTGALSYDPALQTLAKHCKGYSLRECAEHSTIYAVTDELEHISKAAKDPNMGIYCVDMVSQSLKVAQNLLRHAHKKHFPSPKEWNFEDRGLSSQWNAKETSLQKDLIIEVQNIFLQEKGYDLDILSLVEIDQYGRLFYEFQEGVETRIKPGLLMSLEKTLQKKLGERLEVFLTEMKDKHKLRRL